MTTRKIGDYEITRQPGEAMVLANKDGIIKGLAFKSEGDDDWTVHYAGSMRGDVALNDEEVLGYFEREIEEKV